MRGERWEVGQAGNLSLLISALEITGSASIDSFHQNPEGLAELLWRRLLAGELGLEIRRLLPICDFSQANSLRYSEFCMYIS
jgi:hypothetical protein